MIANLLFSDVIITIKLNSYIVTLPLLPENTTEE